MCNCAGTFKKGGVSTKVLEATSVGVAFKVIFMLYHVGDGLEILKQNDFLLETYY